MSTVRPIGLFAAPVSVRGKRQHSRLTVYGRWLLNLVGGSELVAAEAQLIETKFKCLWLFVSNPEVGSWDEPALHDALSFLISSLFLMTKADQIKLVSSSGAALTRFSPLSCVAVRQIWTPYQSMARLAGDDDAVRMVEMIVDPVGWWQQSFAAEFRSKLSYLERRAAKTAKESPHSPKKRRRSWLRPWG